MNGAARGTAMIETAIVLSLVLILLYGVMQIGIWGYSQVTTEGAAFVGSHAASVNSSGSQTTDQTYANSVASLAFPGVSAGGPFSFSLTYPQSNVIQTIVTNNAVVGLNMFSGSPPVPVTVQGGDIEPILANRSNTGSTNGGFGAQATLANYCFFKANGTSSCPGTRSLYITQYDDIYGKGNGTNGQFHEWNCRPGLFPAWGGAYFPTTYPTTGGAGTQYDPASASFGESSLYLFDTSNQWGKQSSC